MIDEIVDSVDEHRFRAEISVSAQLKHLNIVRLRFGRDRRQTVLRDAVHRGRVAPCPDLTSGTVLRARSIPLRIIEDIARALDFAHRRCAAARGAGFGVSFCVLLDQRAKGVALQLEIVIRRARPRQIGRAVKID